MVEVLIASLTEELTLKFQPTAQQKASSCFFSFKCREKIENNSLFMTVISVQAAHLRCFSC